MVCSARPRRVDDTRFKAQDPDRFPAQLPKPMARTPDAARGLYCAAEIAFVVADAHADHVVGSTAGAALSGLPLHRLDHQLDCLEPTARPRVVEVTDADQRSPKRATSFLVPGTPGRSVRRVSIARNAG
jgi:hypothetical protein